MKKLLFVLLICFLAVVSVSAKAQLQLQEFIESSIEAKKKKDQEEKNKKEEEKKKKEELKKRKEEEKKRIEEQQRLERRKIQENPVIFSRATAIIIPKPTSEEDDPEERQLTYVVEVQRGLEVFPEDMQFLSEFTENGGIYFIFSRPEQVTFNLKQVYVSRDILLINEKGEVVEVLRKLPPRSEEPIKSKNKIKALLQINGGSAKKYGIRKGDKVKLITPGPVIESE